MRRAITRTAVLTTGLAVLSTVAGCGIRGTAVPVDAGSAPSRATCVMRPGPHSAPPPGSITISVQLVCTSQLLPVTRVVAVQEDDQAVSLARALLDELRRQPAPVEEEAGFSTDVPQRLTVSGPRKGDPDRTLRLNTAPDELPAPALAQVVCTYAGTAAADGRSTVVLGGPGEDKPRGYTCTEETRTHPETVRSTGGAS